MIKKHKQLKKIRNVRKKLLLWYKTQGRKFHWRKKNAKQYDLIISELLLQRTRAEVVNAFFPRFISAYPNWRILLNTNVKMLGKLLQPLGLWQRRTQSLMKLAREMYKRKGIFPSKREEIESLPGVGQYIANAIELFCENKSRPLLDVNMARVMERVFGPRSLSDIRYDPYLQALCMSVVRCKQRKEINWSIIDFASKICLIKKPKCHACIISNQCSYFRKI